MNSFFSGVELNWSEVSGSETNINRATAIEEVQFISEHDPATAEFGMEDYATLLQRSTANLGI